MLTALLIADIVLTAAIGILTLVAPRTATTADDKALEYAKTAEDAVKALEKGLGGAGDPGAK